MILIQYIYKDVQPNCQPFSVYNAANSAARENLFDNYAFLVLDRETDDLELDIPVRYLWALNIPEERRSIPEELVIIDEENIQGISGASLSLQEGHGKRVKHDRPLVHLLNWLVTQ